VNDHPLHRQEDHPRLAANQYIDDHRYNISMTIDVLSGLIHLVRTGNFLDRSRLFPSGSRSILRD
jgi:hypothetical protein